MQNYTQLPTTNHTLGKVSPRLGKAIDREDWSEVERLLRSFSLERRRNEISEAVERNPQFLLLEALQVFIKVEPLT